MLPKLLQCLTLVVVSPEFETARGGKRRIVFLISFFLSFLLSFLLVKNFIPG